MCDRKRFFAETPKPKDIVSKLPKFGRNQNFGPKIIFGQKSYLHSILPFSFENGSFGRNLRPNMGKLVVP